MPISCLPKKVVNEFLEKLKSGEIDPQKLTDMTSEERNKFFAGFMGEANATRVNAQFESKLLLKNQQLGIINWAKNISGIKPVAKRDILSRVQRMDNILQPKDMDTFLADLAAQRLNIGVTLEEAGNISDLAKTVADKKILIKETSPIRSPERMEYGTALVGFQDYVASLKVEAKKLTPKEFLMNPLKWIEEVGSITKSIAASMDISFFGRQGFVSLVTAPDIWVKNYLKAWGDIGKELKKVDSMTPIKADVFSRPNAINGKYQAMKLDIGIESEEAFPSQLPEKIPLLGRLFKASESAYNGAALRIRADLADRLIPEFEAMDINVTDPDTGLGIMINSMTGRGRVNVTPAQAKFVNATVFSIKYLKSNLDILTAHMLDKKVSPAVKKKAANNLIRVIGAIGGILAISKLLDPDSVEEDPRSTNFGKIMVGKKREHKINVSLGFNSIVTLAFRTVIPTRHKGEWGLWMKNSKGKIVKVTGTKFGARDASDLIFDFMKGKAAPITRRLLNFWEGRTFDGEKPTLIGETKELATPIPVGNLFELSEGTAGANALMFAILSALDLHGVNVNTVKKRKGKLKR